MLHQDAKITYHCSVCPFPHYIYIFEKNGQHHTLFESKHKDSSDSSDEPQLDYLGRQLSSILCGNLNDAIKFEDTQPKKLVIHWGKCKTTITFSAKKEINSPGSRTLQNLLMAAIWQGNDFEFGGNQFFVHQESCEAFVVQRNAKEIIAKGIVDALLSELHIKSYFSKELNTILAIEMLRKGAN